MNVLYRLVAVGFCIAGIGGLCDFWSISEGHSLALGILGLLCYLVTLANDLSDIKIATRTQAVLRHIDIGRK